MLGLGAVVLFMAAMAVGATFFSQESHDELAARMERTGAKEALAAQMKALLLERSSAMRDSGLRSEAEPMQADPDRAKALGDRYGQAIERMAKMRLAPEEREILEKVRAVDPRTEGAFREALARLNAFIELQKRANRAAMEEATRTGSRMAATVYVAQAIGLLAFLLMAWLLERGIARPLDEALRVTSRAAAGGLTGATRAGERDEVAELLAALRQMKDGLGRAAPQIHAGSESIAVGASRRAAPSTSAVAAALDEDGWREL